MASKNFLIPLALLTLLIVPTSPALAAWDINGGLMNVFNLFKLIVLIASVVGFIKEIWSRRSLLYIVGLLLMATFIYSSYEPGEIRQMGNGIKAFLKININKDVQPQQPNPGVKSTPEPQAPNTDQLNNNETVQP
ncbi:hypothetical protein Dred_0789 [Desulforamulus reducens MI-1]|uniref:Uncharacterized protein n=1 Tax=Desulforamulus reducens (strain ATCC BAA-1160 / DSM 100696 / MI-1) TaxID=349161 RepID=A4J2M4_DESRM|nr:hypothetical protein [Desulforamulus reducens]ABO49327.1 hypothetical protein Dred_0789 [Desulforamulus reducens MI-1]